MWSLVVIHALYVTKQHSSTLSKACPASAAAAVLLAPAAPQAPPEATRQAHAWGTERDSCGSFGAPPASGGPFPQRDARAEMDSGWRSSMGTKYNGLLEQNLCPKDKWDFLHQTMPDPHQGSIFIRRARSTAAANSAFFRCSSSSASRFPGR